MKHTISMEKPKYHPKAVTFAKKKIKYFKEV